MRASLAITVEPIAGSFDDLLEDCYQISQRTGVAVKFNRVTESWVVFPCGIAISEADAFKRTEDAEWMEWTSYRRWLEGRANTSIDKPFRIVRIDSEKRKLA
jgi:hypothetical protein